jgi:hypothetical protein
MSILNINRHMTTGESQRKTGGFIKTLTFDTARILGRQNRLITSCLEFWWEKLSRRPVILRFFGFIKKKKKKKKTEQKPFRNLSDCLARQASKKIFCTSMYTTQVAYSYRIGTYSFKGTVLHKSAQFRSWLQPSTDTVFNKELALHRGWSHCIFLPLLSSAQATKCHQINFLLMLCWLCYFVLINLWINSRSIPQPFKVLSHLPPF